MKTVSTFSFLFLFLSSVLGQQVLTTTNQAGNTIVVQITTNAFGQTLTQVLQTLQPGAVASTTSTPTALTAASTTAAATAASTPATATATPAAVTTQAQQGPVGQPGSTPAEAGDPTPFVYTTTDANGNYVTVEATFTPSFPQTTPYTPTGSGTVLQYSAWLSMIGSNTGAIGNPVASQGANPASRAHVNIALLLGTMSTALMTLLGPLVVGLI